MGITNSKYVALTTFAVSSLLIGCSEELSENVSQGIYKPSLESHYLSVYPRDFEFGSGEETKSGEIASENAWAFTDAPSWLSLTPTNGISDEAFSIKSTANETMTRKAAVFYLSANNLEWNKQIVLTANQASASPYIQFVDLENTSLYLSGESQTLTVNIDTNITDLAVEVENAEGWLNASYQNKQLTINVNDNDDGYERTGNVLLWSSSCSEAQIITITQHAPNFSFNEVSALSFDADGGSQTVKVSSEIPWHASSNESWIEITPVEGNAGDSQVKISTLPSYQSGNRNGRAMFYYKNKESEVDFISVSQNGRYINIIPDAITLSAEGNDSETIDISSNIGWEISKCPEWLSLSQNNGNAGNSTITVTAQKNNSLNSRYGTISIKDSKSGGITQSVSVVQNGLDFGDQTTLEFSWHQSSLPLEIPFPGAWSAAVSDGWITMSQYTGTGATTCDIIVSRNDSPDVRTGEIVFTSEGKSMSINVVQNGQYIKLDNTSGEFSAMGGSLSLMVASSVNTSWKIEYEDSDAKWVNVDKISDEEYSIKVDYNPSSLDRNATFILYPTDNDVSDTYTQGVKLAIKQAGRTLSCDNSKIIMFAAGGTSQTYKISADGKYSIEKMPGDNWYTIVSDTTTQTFYIVVTDNTSGSDRTGHIILSLLELPTRESVTRDISVFQYKPGVNITFDNFEEEKIW